ncbi:MAG: VWA domain-containing protein [Mycobacterium sp.]|uniref:VWA domain-containing protein n=1 Tax=Mycobacterium sp. TaxID=1785 RepID=UPI003F9DD024
MVRLPIQLRLVAVVGAALLLLGWSAPDADADNNSAAGHYGACLAAQKSGDLLMLFDESSSLQSTDRNAARVSAAKYLVQTLARYADRVGADLNIAIAGFSDQYVLHQNWTKLSGHTATVTGPLDAQAARNTGIDTDYWLALDGARQTLASRGSGPNGGDRCQAIAWFSDGKIDFTPRPQSKPYADGIKLDGPNGIDEMVRKATESICRAGGVADQLRSRGIVMLAVGLSGDGAPSDFDAMSAISTGTGIAGMLCGDIKQPKPGDFYPVSNLDDMLFAFDGLNPDPGVTGQGPVCHLQVCPEARHNFVLDRSIKSVTILGSGGVPGIVPYLISPSGQQLALPNKPGKTNTQIDGVGVEYEWQSDSAQNVRISNSGGPEWAGQWAIVYVDTTGEHSDAVSKVSIHITTDIYPALVNQVAWHSGGLVKGLTFGLADGQGHPLSLADLAGAATLSAALVPDGAAPIPLLVSVPKTDIATPVNADLTAVKPGHAVLRMSLVITTAPAAGPDGQQIADGTTLSPQEVDVPIQVLPRVGLPTPGSRIDFGALQGAKGTTASLPITGPGCAWIADADAAKVVAGPDGVGATHIGSSANGPANCVKVQAGQTLNLPVTLHTDRDGRGGLDGTVPVHISALDDPNNAQVVDVPFVASLTKPLSTTNFVLVFIAALLLGPGIPLLLLYGSKWLSSKIPSTPLLAERIPVAVKGDAVLRDGAPFAMAETDLVRPVPGLAKSTRRLTVQGVTLTAVMGRSPFGSGHVRVDADGRVGVGSRIPGTDRTGLRAVLPLAVHNTWVLLHDPQGPASAAEVLLLVGGRTDTAARQRIYDDVARRGPELLKALRLRALEAGIGGAHDSAAQASPFGDVKSAVPQHDPFDADRRAVTHQASRQAWSEPFDPFTGGN